MPRPLVAALLVLGPFGLDAALHEWTFDDPEGTSLRHPDNNRNLLGFWSQALTNSQTTGEGTFRSQRNGGGQNSRFDVGSAGGAEYVYRVATIAGWDFSHTVGADPLIRFSFMNGPAADTPGQITAEAVLVSNGDDGVTLQARALGTGGQYIMVVPRLDLVLAHKTHSSGTNLSVSRSGFYERADILVRGMSE